MKDRIMFSVILLFMLPSSLVKGSGTPWYPVMVPIHTGGHRHTTHVVTHPIVHTRVLMLESHEQNHQHENDYDHYKYGYQKDSHQGKQSTHGRYSERDPTNAKTTPHPVTMTRGRNYDEYPKHGGHSYSDDSYHSQPEIKYSVLVSESPWKPLSRVPNHVPKGYLPLKYLGIDEEHVSRVVKEALNEIERDMDAAQHTRPRYPTGIQDLIGSRVKPLPPMYRGAVFYDDEPGKNRHMPNTRGRVPTYHLSKDLSRENALKLKLECQCETPY